MPELVRNSFGPLTGTVPHMVNLDGIYSFDFRRAGRLTLAAKAALRVDEVYSFEAARPIAGGDIDDLEHAKVHRPGGGDGFFDRDIVRPQGNFGVETRFQQPVSAQFELALRF